MNPPVVERYRCDYCGGTVDPRYHFCIHCATVYREPDEEVYGETPPPKLSLEHHITTKAGSTWKFFCVIALGLVVIGIFSQVLGEERLGLSLFLQDVFLFTVTVGYLIYHWRDVAHVFVDVRFDWVFVASFPMLAAFLGLNKVYHDLLFSLLDLDKETAIDPLLENLSPWSLFFSICVFPGIVEELGFRAVVQERMVKAVGTVVGFAATSVLFTALHFSIFSAPYLFLLSMFLCWVRARTRTIYLPMVLHFIHNFVVLVVFYGVRL